MSNPDAGPSVLRWTTPIAAAWLLASMFMAAGILLWFVARPMAKLAVW